MWRPAGKPHMISNTPKGVSNMAVGRKTYLAIAILGLAVGGSFLAAGPAAAGTGCNGVVSMAEWGCAPWDNNNGPQFPHFKHPAAAAPSRAAPSTALAGRNANGIMVNNGANVISNDGASVVSHDGASLVGNSGGTARPRGNRN
jgi:hypothetical protein